jgi:AcrR family transcriptional regulator
MSPRPRTASDDQIFAALHRVVSRLGPARMTLADVAGEVGITAAALVQRYGSKRDLLLAVSRHSMAAFRDHVAAIRAANTSPLDALTDFVASMARYTKTPNELANQLAMFQLDLTDPEFHALGLAYFRAERRELKSMLDDAIRSGEVVAETDTAQLARMVQVVMNGGRLVWAVVRDGSLERWTREDLDVLLAPYRASRRSASRVRRTVTRA